MLSHLFSPLRASSPGNLASKKDTNSYLDQYVRIEDDESKSGKHADVFIVKSKNRATPSAKSYAIKRDGDRTRAARECMIFSQLAKLFFQAKCFNFVLLYENPEGTLDDPCMHLVMECADYTLASLKSDLSFVEIREILFQIVWSLYIAGKELEFTHYDMHLKNILIIKNQQKKCIYIDRKRTWQISGANIVKITDFGLSRIKLRKSSKVVANHKNPIMTLFQPQSDIQQLSTDLAQIKLTTCSPAQRKELSAFRRKLTKGILPKILLRDPFFASLIRKEPSLDLTSDKFLVVSSSGHSGIPKQLLEHACHTPKPKEFLNLLKTPYRRPSPSARNNENQSPNVPYIPKKKSSKDVTKRSFDRAIQHEAKKQKGSCKKKARCYHQTETER
eukprot:TRINITY_DN10282_c0_g1_i2.p1 TRINITY_DN10282_c0_g1~~TRINITY_DN10282_c0_g1_i2.p1  ORF type:complete len:389 (-),score=70.23 TRINITY_DN10282_c0_g1_i2:87-1253(-)